MESGKCVIEEKVRDTLVVSRNILAHVIYIKNISIMKEISFYPLLFTSQPGFGLTHTRGMFIDTGFCADFIMAHAEETSLSSPSHYDYVPE